MTTSGRREGTAEGSPDPWQSPSRELLRVDAWLLENLGEAADWIQAHGGPAELSTLVRVAATELKQFYAADLISERAGAVPDRDEAG